MSCQLHWLHCPLVTCSWPYPRWPQERSASLSHRNHCVCVAGRGVGGLHKALPSSFSTCLPESPKGQRGRGLPTNQTLPLQADPPGQPHLRCVRGPWSPRPPQLPGVSVTGPGNDPVRLTGQALCKICSFGFSEAVSPSSPWTRGRPLLQAEDPLSGAISEPPGEATAVTCVLRGKGSDTAQPAWCSAAKRLGGELAPNYLLV